ncbi:MAG: hypothetical protein HPY71_03750 [Firmicutes bacterium]|nr:hypothetical protein [Bacillota bacterium]
MTVEVVVLLAVVAFLAGYIIGHRHGALEGYRVGSIFAPLELRRQSLERGRCIICGIGMKDPQTGDNASGTRQGPGGLRAGWG